MKYDVRIMTPAKNDLREIRRYIADEFQNPEAANRRAALLYEKMKSLNENPARFSLVRDKFLSKKGIRLMVVKSQNVFYVIREEQNVVSVIRILNERRNWMRILKEEISDI
jgi:plasmid stabilization system protein ParE